MKTRRVSARIVSALLLGALAAVAQTPCPPLTDAQRAKLVEYVQKKYKAPSTSPLDVAQTAVIGDTCYRKLEFTSRDPRRAFQLALIATPDLRFLTRELLDSEVDPVVEERQKLQAMQDGLSRGKFPVLGAKDAPVTITVFSDFQCPYCAQAGIGMVKDLLPSEEGKVRLAFRYFPLAMHPWARGAAEAASCAQEQGDRYFWSLHDYLFERQKEITVESVQRRLLGQAAQLASFDSKKFETCLDTKAGAARVDADIAFGKEAGVTGTPSIFVNGLRQSSGYNPVQLRTLIREITEGPASGAGSAPRQ
jgi:protein-disulfide isomerase